MKEIHPKVVLKEPFQVASFCLIGVEMDLYPSSLLNIGPRSIIRSHTIIYHGCQIGSDFTTGHHVLIREYAQIGDGVSIGTHSVLEHHVTIGNRVRIHSGAFIPEYSILEDDCWIGPSVVLTNAKYPKSIDAKQNLTGVTIKKGAKIGAHATLLPGITVGAYALIGAGAVVVKDVPSYAVIAGSPAKQINHLDNLPYSKEGSHAYSSC